LTPTFGTPEWCIVCSIKVSDQSQRPALATARIGQHRVVQSQPTTIDSSNGTQHSSQWCGHRCRCQPLRIEPGTPAEKSGDEVCAVHTPARPVALLRHPPRASQQRRLEQQRSHRHPVERTATERAKSFKSIPAGNSTRRTSTPSSPRALPSRSAA
jgi:hypothetical protein